MPILRSDALMDFVAAIFRASGVEDDIAAAVADHLVAANLKGHDSHGVIRVMQYIDSMEQGVINPAGRPQVVRADASLLVIDGQQGLGAFLGRAATRLAIEKTRATGLCVLAVRRAGHMGRIGEYAEIAARAGLASFFFSNGGGAGVLTAPHGGYQRRLSANPVAAGAPLPDGGMMIMDMACSIVAEGKLRVARSRGEQVAPGLIVDSRGQASTDPEDFYGPPPGALLPFGGHKGFALSMFVEVFAGALTGGGCSRPPGHPLANTLLGLFLDPGALCGSDVFVGEMGALIDWVKSSATLPGTDEILIPGEPERRMEARRRENGIPIDDATWSGIVEIAARLGLPAPGA